MTNVIFSKGAFIEGQDTSEVRGRVREGCEKLLVCRWLYCINDDGSGNDDSVSSSAMDKVPSFLSRLMTTSSSSRGSKVYSVLATVVIVFFENCRCSEII
jgi:hypothetical protein